MLNRRHFLVSSLATLGGACASPVRVHDRSLADDPPATATATPTATEAAAVDLAPAFLPEPDFQATLGWSAGIRPYRTGSYRLELEDFGGRPLVHNYGHGGSGLTVSWGVASRAVELLARQLPKHSEVAVLGAGVVGLSTAYLLLERGLRPTLFARDRSPDTTSDRAGGQWAPSLIAIGSDADARSRFEGILLDSLERFRALMGSEYGVHERPNYVTNGRSSGLLRVSDRILPAAERLDRLPFERVTQGGFVRRTLLVDPSRYLPRLTWGLEDRGVEIRRHDFESIEDVQALEAAGIVNCLGLGAGALFADERVRPVRGQLVHLAPDAKLDWLLSHGGGYVFPRSDSVVLGGTVERGVSDDIPDASACHGILQRNEGFFADSSRD